MDCLCDLDKKVLEKKLEKIMGMVDQPRYICRACARAANEKELVCKPVKITRKDSSS